MKAKLQENSQIVAGLSMILVGGLLEYVDPDKFSFIFMLGGSYIVVGGFFQSLTGKPEHLFERRRVIGSAFTQGLLLLVSVAIAISASKSFFGVAALACIALLILGFALISREDAKPQVAPTRTLPPLARLITLQWIGVGKLLGMSLVGVSLVPLNGTEQWRYSELTALLLFLVPLGLGLIAAAYIAIARRPPYFLKEPRSADPDTPRATRAYVGLTVLLGIPYDLALIVFLVMIFFSLAPGITAGLGIAAAMDALVTARWERSNNSLLLCEPGVEGIAKEHYVIPLNKQGRLELNDS